MILPRLAVLLESVFLHYEALHIKSHWIYIVQQFFWTPWSYSVQNLEVSDSTLSSGISRDSVHTFSEMFLQTIANLQISPDFQAHQKKIWMALYLSGCGGGRRRRPRRLGTRTNMSETEVE